MELIAGHVYHVRAKRGHTFGNVYNYDYWKCPDCGYYPGSSYGPPQRRCGNCGANLYADQPGEETMAILIFQTRCGLGFTWASKS